MHLIEVIAYILFYVQILILLLLGPIHGRCLGMRSRGTRCALHDPNADGALVLYTPSELTAHEKLSIDKWAI